MRVIRLFALALLILGSFVSPALADSVATGSITGNVVDADSGFRLAGALVTAMGPVTAQATTDAKGHFTISGLTAGRYTLRIQMPGYQTTLSDQVPINPGMSQDVTLALSRVAGGGQTIRTLGRTTIRASQSLIRSTVVIKEASIEVVERSGNYRLGDYLRTLPQINAGGTATGGSDNPSPGDDQYLDIRGIGSLETVALIDGHPIGFGINRGKNFGYNFDTAPTFAFRSVDVIYGSGVSGLMPYSAIGGVINMLTLQPTPLQEANLTQGWGTFNKLVTSFNATGTYENRLGYAVAVGTQGLDGPYKNMYPFQPSAAFDPSAPPGTLAHDSGIYKDDTSVVNRGDYLKLRYAIGSANRPAFLTLSGLSAYYWDDKTGNGDQDFLPFDTALAIGNQALAGFTGSCPAGQFTPTNANGSPWGIGPNGKPDGGLTCVTPRQFASIASGLQGAGTTFQTFTINDYNLRYDQPLGKSTLSLDAFANRWFQLYDRTFQLPFIAQPGDNAFWLSPQVNTTGGAIEDTLGGSTNDVGVGLAYNNYAYLFKQNGAQLPSPVVHDESFYLQDVFHPVGTSYKIYFNGTEVHSVITKSTYFDPRLAFVDSLANNNTVRIAAGTTAIQPYATMIDLPFSPIAVGSLNGVLNCTGLTSIGSLANPNLTRERANDQEISFGHNFQQDSQLQLTLYNENINDKIFNAVIPTAGLPPGTVDPATLTKFETAINSACGTPGAGLTHVGVSSYANIGRFLARGIDVSGRARISRHFFTDLNYSTESTTLRSIPVDILQSNLTYIVGAQLPAVPLHKGQVALDYTFARNVDVRLAQSFVSANNSKNSPAYNYGDLTISSPLGSGTVNLAVDNIFNQYVQYIGLIGKGVPLALNQYATPGSYGPPAAGANAALIGNQATELFGLPYRTFFISYTFHAR